MKITHPDDLGELRNRTSQTEIQVDADGFLTGNLPLYLFKYVAWALTEGGRATVRSARTIDSVSVVPGAWSFQFLVQAACKAIEGIAELTEVDVENRTFSFQRHSTSLAPGPWSAVVMFSGRKEELPQLDTCLRSLMIQPELAEGGQIVICGPTASSDVVASYPGVEYLPYETPTAAGRFLVGKKKNFAVAHMRFERILVCHTRIALHKGCLNHIPTEFDVITPRVQIRTESGRFLPSVDLFFMKLSSTSVYTDTPHLALGYSREGWRRYLRDHYPYVDGGLFCVRKEVLLSTPLSETLAWGEGEDLEWCRRLLFQGRVVELAERATAESLVNKTGNYAKFGHLAGFRLVSRVRAYARTFLHRYLH